MRRVLAIVDRDGAYASRLAAYFNDRETTGLKATAFTDLETYRKYRKNVMVEILLISEELAAKAHGMTEGAKIILLSEDGFVTDGENRPFHAPAVFKYMPADRLGREIMNLYADDDTHVIQRVSSGDCEILGIYSPANRCGKTTLALTLGLVRAERGRTLLISLEEYAGVFRSIVRDPVTDFSDVVYCYLQNSWSWSRLKGTVHSFGPLDFIPPVRCAEDVSLLPSEDMTALLRRIAEESGYATVIIDFGSFGRRAVELLDLCGRIFLPVPEDPAAELKVESFYEYLEKIGRSELKDRIVKCRLPWEPENAQAAARGLISAYESGALREFAERLH